jgi:hypothetical protein
MNPLVEQAEMFHEGSSCWSTTVGTGCSSQGHKIWFKITAEVKAESLMVSFPNSKIYFTIILDIFD